MASLYELTNDYVKLMGMLYDDEMDEQTILDTLESIETVMEDKCDSIAMVMNELQGDIDKIDKEIKRLQARKKTLENNHDRLKRYIEIAMRAAGKAKFKTNLFNFSIRKAGARSLVLTVEPDQLPEEFRVVTVSADKTAIKDAMKAQGVEALDFAYLAPASEYVSIK
ncbi:MAG: siphovirus Gp157 family protein [Peptococcaceae bacterium]|nr:siphovirus Gp157 family protein [Peptococcaceae bacterium]